MLGSNSLKNIVVETGKALDTLKESLNTAGLQINESKTEIVVLHGLGLKKYKPPLVKIRYKNTSLQSKSAIKYLGLTVDNQLTWDYQSTSALKVKN